ncbi:hypothetical protein GQ55_5G517700 [Panicum hallii var. hallii]|uniref:Secreted protein n=1 Tax=Panicum hallii var. hallii TaxID=1504633 RepID=A0A2T7DSJ0_9POAL|nr:hypothetical protein GQ55_5G517700 [Panicum hallii var. hallii]
MLCCAADSAGAASRPFISGTVCPAGLLKLLLLLSLPPPLPEEIRTCSCTLLQVRSNSLSNHTCTCVRVHLAFNGGRSMESRVVSWRRSRPQRKHRGSTSSSSFFFSFSILYGAWQFNFLRV